MQLKVRPRRSERAEKTGLFRKSSDESGEPRIGVRQQKLTRSAARSDDALIHEDHPIGQLISETDLVGDEPLSFPRRRVWRIAGSTSPTNSRSSAEVGSSNSMMVGCMASARAMATGRWVARRMRFCGFGGDSHHWLASFQPVTSSRTILHLSSQTEEPFKR